MKTLNHHVLIFDEDCPMCRAYTGAFIKTGMLDRNGRKAYCEMDDATSSLLDLDKARNEIALVNTKTGNVIYGIDSLFTVLAHAFPFFGPLFRFKPFRWLMKKVYAFISYNRKVIIPSDHKKTGCVPDYKLTYRWVYIVFTWLATSLVLTNYSGLLQGIIPESKFFREFLICGGQIVFQSCILFFIAGNRTLDYLGNMMTISFAGGLVLLFVMGFGNLFHVTQAVFYALAFMLVAAAMFLEHWRRMKLIGIHWFLSMSWVIYRLIVLCLIS